MVRARRDRAAYESGRAACDSDHATCESAAVGPRRRRVGAAWIPVWAVAIALIHLAFLVISLSDYRVTIDSAYHLSLARRFSGHWFVPWENINYGPYGRPNLQGPLLYVAIAELGKMLGGSGSDFVLANAILGVCQWTAAVATAGFFAYRLGGEVALLLAVSIFSGAGFAATSFAVGLPSGWLFILTPWAIYFYQRGRVMFAVLLTSAAIYAHLGGFLTAPLGLVIAAILTASWWRLFQVGAASAILTAPYTIHVIRNLGWLSGVSSHSALLFDPMLYGMAVVAGIRVFRNPRRNPFMAAWLSAPLPWLFQDPGRFLLQSALAGSVIAALGIVTVLDRIPNRGRRSLWLIGIVGVSTAMPLGPPALAAEIAWCSGLRYPRAVNWEEARTLENDLERGRLAGRVIAGYSPDSCPALAVFGAVTCEKGHWVEVQPRYDPSDNLPVEAKVYILPLSPDDPALIEFEKRGWLQVYGATPTTLVATIGGQRPSVSTAAPIIAQTIADSAAWLANNAVNNTLTLHDWPLISDRSGLSGIRGRLKMQRGYAGRIELVCLIYAWTIEPVAAKDASEARRAARGFGVIASFLSDDFAIDFLSEARLAELKAALRRLGANAAALKAGSPQNRRFLAALTAVIDSTLETERDTFSARPRGNLLPWLSGI